MSAFTNVPWDDDEDVTAEKLNQMNSNDNWVKDRIIPIKYMAHGITKVDGLKILAGVVSLGPGTSPQLARDVYFNGYFTTNSRPIVTATLATPAQYRTFCVIKGIGGNDLKPSDRGFTIVINSDAPSTTKTHFPTAQQVHWIAIGY